MEGIWLGENEKAYFKFDDLEPNRKLSLPIYPREYYDLLKDPSFKYAPKRQDEIRIISNDIALILGSENDASVYTIIRLIPNGKTYTREIVYMETMDGGHSATQAIRIHQMYESFECDYIVLDTSGVGMSIYDNLCQNMYDKDNKKDYDAFSCMNNEEMAKRCQIENAPKKIYSVKAFPQFNSDCAVGFKDDLKKGKIKLLINENDSKEVLNGFKGFSKLPYETQLKLALPYYNATFLVNEMVNLEADINQDTGIVKLKEPRSGRKDRWSSVAYGNYFATILEKELLKETKTSNILDFCM